MPQAANCRILRQENDKRILTGNRSLTVRKPDYSRKLTVIESGIDQSLTTYYCTKVNCSTSEKNNYRINTELIKYMTGYYFTIAKIKKIYKFK